MRKYMVESFDGDKVYFVDYSFKSAMDQAQDYMDNLAKKSIECWLYYRNQSRVGPKWIKM